MEFTRLFVALLPLKMTNDSGCTGGIELMPSALFSQAVTNDYTDLDLGLWV